MAIFDFTFPGTQAQALYIEDAVHAIKRRGCGLDKEDEGTPFPWLASLDTRTMAANLCLADVRISHDEARMEIRVCPSSEGRGVEHEEMGVEAVAVALMMMKAHFGVETPTAFTFRVQKHPETILRMSVAEGGTVAVSKHRVQMETFAQTAERLANVITA